MYSKDDLKNNPEKYPDLTDEEHLKTHIVQSLQKFNITLEGLIHKTPIHIISIYPYTSRKFCES